MYRAMGRKWIRKRASIYTKSVLPEQAVPRLAWACHRARRRHGLVPLLESDKVRLMHGLARTCH